MLDNFGSARNTPTPMRLTIPRTTADTIELTLEPGQQLFVVGPNGGGKSAVLQHFATSNPNSQIRRVAAHRQTWFQSGGITMTAASRREFERYRPENEREESYRWRDSAPEESLSAVLFDLVAKENARARAVTKHIDESDADRALQAAERSESPFVALNALLELGALTVSVDNSNDIELVASHPDTEAFPLPKMSDGERSAVIIAATVLTVDPGTTLLIDEPERHLHRAIIAPFLAALFKSRSDCIFVVSTHQMALSLAAPDAEVLVARSCAWCDGQPSAWDADLIAPNTALPEDLKLAVLGGRQTLLFVEGSPSSLDPPMYEALFPGVAVIPSNGCTEVQRAVAGLRNTADHHYVRAFGLIDRDTRSDDEVNQLETKGVFALDVHSVEALYYCSESIRAVAERQGASLGSDSGAMAGSAKSNALAHLANPNVGERMAARRCEGIARHRGLEQTPTWKSTLEHGGCTGPIHVCIPYEAEFKRFHRFLGERNLDSLVARYPIRETGAFKCIAEALRCSVPHDYERMVATQVGASDALRNALKDKVHALAIALETDTVAGASRSSAGQIERRRSCRG